MHLDFELQVDEIENNDGDQNMDHQLLVNPSLYIEPIPRPVYTDRARVMATTSAPALFN